MTEVEKVVKVQAEQVASGYTCKDKKSKYAKDIDDHMDTWQWYNGKKYGFDWCTCYFDWCMIYALGVERARKALNRPKNSLGAGVRYSREYLKAIGRVDNTPTVGCAVYFGSLPYPRHIGFVYKVTDKMIYTYEGNCYVSNGISGIKAKSYYRTNKDILDYGHPVYDETPDPGPKELDGYKVGETYEVKYNDLQIRKGPGTNYASVGELNQGDLVTCTALNSDSSGRTWLQHKAGWSCAHEGSKRYIDQIVTKTGWVKENGKWYYYDTSGKMVKSQWKLYKGYWYYLGADGYMLTGWQTINGSKYYLYPEGHMASGEYIEGMFIDMSGKQIYNDKFEWKSDSKGKWYQDPYGCYIKSRSMLIDGIEYEFNSTGYVINK